MDDNRATDLYARRAFQLAIQLMSARTLQDDQASALAVQDIADFLSADPETTHVRVTAYIKANGHLSSLLIHTAARYADTGPDALLSQLTLYAARRLDDTPI